MTNRLTSATAILALLLLASPLSAARTDRPSVIAGGEIASSGASGDFTYRPGIEGRFLPVEGEPLMRLRYRLWTLVGEPVWVFTGKAPRLSRIRLTDASSDTTLLIIQREDTLASGTVNWNGVNHVSVSPDLMDLARVYDFSFQAVLSQAALNRLPGPLRADSPAATRPIGAVSIYRSYQGILASPGEWGWSVPGSPSWRDTFVNRGMVRPAFTPASFDEDRLDPESAREVMRRLLYAYHANETQPLIHLETGDFHLNIHDLIRAIREAESEALRALHGLHSVYDERFDQIIEAHGESVRRNGLTPELEREARAIDAFVSRHRERLSGGVLAAWEAIRSHAASVAPDRQAAAYLRELGPVVARQLASGQLQFPANLNQGLEQARRFFASAEVSEAMMTRWTTLQSALEPGAGGELIAERYRDNGDGTVTDVETGLQWMRCSYGQTWNAVDESCAGEARRVYSESLPGPVSYAGYRDWRVPTIDELSSLIYCRASSHPDYLRMVSNPAPEASDDVSCEDQLDARGGYRMIGVFNLRFGRDRHYLSSTVTTTRGYEPSSQRWSESRVSHGVDFWTGQPWSQWSEVVLDRDDDYRLYLVLVRDPN